MRPGNNIKLLPTDDKEEYNGPVMINSGFFLICFHILWLTWLLIMEILGLCGVIFGKLYGSDQALRWLSLLICDKSIGYSMHGTKRWHSVYNLKIELERLMYFPALDYIALAAFVVGIAVNVLLLAIPKLTTSKRYYWAIFAMYWVAWALFNIPISHVVSVAYSKAEGISAINIAGSYQIASFDFSMVKMYSILGAVVGALIPASIAASMYTANENQSCGCIKPYRRLEF